MSFQSRLLLSRVGLLAAVAAALAWAVWHRARVYAAVRAFFSAVTTPTNLAVYRIIFFAAVLVDFGTDYPRSTIDFYARLPHGLQTPPEPAAVWGRLLQWIPVNAFLAHQAISFLKLFGALAMLGLATRLSAWMVVGLALYVLGIPQYYGKVNHTHHLIWFATILAASPCGDALSVDALLRRRLRRPRAGLPLDERPAASRAYALPLRFVWILIGLIYFFPGVHKWWTAGIDWAWSDNFRNRMWEAWYQRDVFADDAWRPVVRLDEHPLVCRLFALGAVAFELTWVFLIFARRWRPVAVVAALAFHLGTYFLMKIQFWSLVLNFVTFVDWSGLTRRLAARRATADAPAPPPHQPLPRVAVATFGVLLAGNVLFGIKGARDGWPFTCYPTFARAIGPEIDQTDVVVTGASGEVIDWDRLELKNQFSKSRYSALMKLLGEERDVRKMRAFWKVLSEQSPRLADARRVEFFAVRYSTEPGPTHAELSRVKVWQADLAPPSAALPSAAVGG